MVFGTTILLIMGCAMCLFVFYLGFYCMNATLLKIEQRTLEVGLKFLKHGFRIRLKASPFRSVILQTEVLERQFDKNN